MPPPSIDILEQLRLESGLDHAAFAQAIHAPGEPERLARLRPDVGALNADLARALVNRFAPSPALRSELLLAGRVLPDEADVQAVWDEAHALLEPHPAPAYLVDFSWRVLACNEATRRLYGLDPAGIATQRPHVMRLLFDASWGVRHRITNWSDVAQEELAAFFLDQATLGTRADAWYRELIDELVGYEDFGAYWAAVESKGRRALLLERGRSHPPVVVRLRSDAASGEDAFIIGYTRVESDRRLRVAHYERATA